MSTSLFLRAGYAHRTRTQVYRKCDCEGHAKKVRGSEITLSNHNKVIPLGKSKLTVHFHEVYCTVVCHHLKSCFYCTSYSTHTTEKLLLPKNKIIYFFL